MHWISSMPRGAACAVIGGASLLCGCRGESNRLTRQAANGSTGGGAMTANAGGDTAATTGAMGTTAGGTGGAGDMQTIALGEKMPRAIVVDEGDVFWVTEFGGEVRTILASGERAS